MKKFDCILVNGDSYSALDPDHLVYSQYLGQQLGIPVINKAFVGTNNQRIIRSTLESIDDLKQYKNPLVIIGWSFIRRIEVWYYGDKDMTSYMPDRIAKAPEVVQPRFLTLEWLLKNNAATLEEKMLVKEFDNVHKELTDFYTNLYMLSTTLKFHGIDYFFFSAAKNTDCNISAFPYVTSLTQVTRCRDDAKMFNLHEFCIEEWATINDPECKPVTKHLSGRGHKKFTEFLWNKIQLAYKE